MLGFGVLLYTLPVSVYAYYTIDVGSGGSCNQIGEWNGSTCTLTTDVDDYIVIRNGFITLDGNGHRIIVPSGERYGVKVDGVDAATVKNLVIEGGGIIFDQADSGKALGNTITASVVGINFFDLNTGLAEGNTITSRNEAYTDSAIALLGTTNVTLRNNYITHADTAISLDQANDSMIELNNIGDTAIGIQVRYSEDTDIVSNRISEAATAALEIQADASGDTTVENNTFQNSERGVKISKSVGDGDDPMPTFSDWSTPIAVRQLFIKVARLFDALIPTVYAQASATHTFFRNNFISNDSHVQVDLGADVAFYLPLPDGGNYWDTFDEAGEGCDDTDDDGFCDTDFVRSVPATIIDEFPHTKPVELSLPTPQCSDGIDNDGDSLTDFPEDPGCENADDNNEVHVPPPSVPTCILSASPSTIMTGESATLTWSSENADTAVIDNGIGIVSPSGSIGVSPVVDSTYNVTFTGSGGEVSCQVTVTVEEETPPEQTLGEKAAELAKALLEVSVDQASAPSDLYELGARGWEYHDERFVEPEEIVNGYTYRSGLINQVVTGPGIDCSGLIYWAFNKSNDSTKAHDNYVANITADGMFGEKQSGSVSGPLQPGDALFFDNDADPQIDHVAMYVGESGDYDVVNAGSEASGITDELATIMATSEFGFVSYRRIHQYKLSSVSSYSPINLIITDPNGLRLSYEDVTTSDLEFIREVPSEMYYSEIEKGRDGQPIDRVYFTELKDGVYKFEVVPDETATSGSTYSLIFTSDETTIELAKDELISEIPPQGFAVEVSNGGEVIEEVGAPLTLEMLFETLSAQISDAEMDSKLLRVRLVLNLKLAQIQYAKNHYRAAQAVLKNLDRLIKRRTGKGISQSDAGKLGTTIDQLLQLL